MASLLEMTANIVAAHAGTSKMTSEDVVGDLKKVYAALNGLRADKAGKSQEKPPPALTVKQAFKKDEVICMVCGKGGMKTLTRHLHFVHDLEPGVYRKQFGIRSSQALTAVSFTESRRAMALELGLADNLAKARLVKASKMKARKSVQAPSAGR